MIQRGGADENENAGTRKTHQEEDSRKGGGVDDLSHSDKEQCVRNNHREKNGTRPIHITHTTNKWEQQRAHQEHDAPDRPESDARHVRVGENILHKLGDTCFERRGDDHHSSGLDMHKECKPRKPQQRPIHSKLASSTATILGRTFSKVYN